MGIERRKCEYCGLKHVEVEAAGMFHCPNPVCNGPGATWFRKTLPSFLEKEDGTHTVIAEDVLSYGMDYLKAHLPLCQILVEQGIIAVEPTKKGEPNASNH